MALHGINIVCIYLACQLVFYVKVSALKQFTSCGYCHSLLWTMLMTCAMVRCSMRSCHRPWDLMSPH